MQRNSVKIFWAPACVSICLGLSLGLSPAHGAEVFTTTGSAGEKVYTDRPDSNAKKVTLQFESGPAGDAAQAKPEDDKSLSEMTPCERAEYIVAQYAEAEVLAEKDADGNTRVLDAAEASAAIERARAEETRLCEDQDDA